MGVQPPEPGDFLEEPETPPRLQHHDQENEDDLYSDTGTKIMTTNSAFTFDHDFRSILPAKGVFEDFLGVNYWDIPTKKNYCAKCYEDVKKDMKKLTEVVNTFKKEWNEARKETETLKKEVEELKKLMNKRGKIKKGDVSINIANGKRKFEVLVRDRHFGNETYNSDKTSDIARLETFGISTFSISLPNENPTLKNTLPIPNPEPKRKKTIAELRREFFAKEFESQQNAFTVNNYLDIAPEKKTVEIPCPEERTLDIKPEKKHLETPHPEERTFDIKPEKKHLEILRPEDRTLEIKPGENVFEIKSGDKLIETKPDLKTLDRKPERAKETFRSKLIIRVKPKKKISDFISKLTSKFGAQNVIEDSPPICMFQRFEKTKNVWVNEFEEIPI